MSPLELGGRRHSWGYSLNTQTITPWAVHAKIIYLWPYMRSEPFKQHGSHTQGGGCEGGG